MKIGSLFSGYGGLDMGVQAVLGGDVAWHAEFDAAPSKILAHHWPTVPNHGDVTTVDWSTVEPVEVLTGGFPCQDLSMAGRRAGMRPGTRSGLWADYLMAIDVLRPQLAVIENVRGLLSGCAESDLEPCPGCVGDGEHRPVLRALGRVLGDLAAIGYDTQWAPIRASDAGAPHDRFRVFVLAYPADLGQERSRSAWFGRDGFADGCDTSADPSSVELERRGGLLDVGDETDRYEGTGWEREWLRDPSVDSGSAASDSGRAGLGRRPGESSSEEAGADSGDESAGDRGLRPADVWGPYRPAIERWERRLGRVAPAPTKPTGKGGAHRLSSEFVEWMMGLPAGHVTGVGISRAHELKALGNGVVPQQAALALSLLLGQEPHNIGSDS